MLDTAPQPLHKNIIECTRDIGAPHLVRPDDRYATQQVWIDLVLRMRFARVRPSCHPRQSHCLHHPLHSLAIDYMPRRPKVRHHFAAAVKRSSGILLVNQPAQQQLDFAGDPRRAPCIHRRA